jgi:hypothetical protein
LALILDNVNIIYYLFSVVRRDQTKSKEVAERPWIPVRRDAWEVLLC